MLLTNFYSIPISSNLMALCLFRVEPCEARPEAPKAPEAETELRILERSVNRARAKRVYE